MILVGGPERLSNAFGALSPLTTPPTLAARAAIVRSVCNTLGGTFDQPGLQPLATWLEFPQFLRDTRGWRPEGDVHRTAEKHAQVFGALCGPTGERRLEGPRAENRARGIAGVARSYTEIELRRLAETHGAAQGEADHGVPALSLRSRGRGAGPGAVRAVVGAALRVGRPCEDGIRRRRVAAHRPPDRQGARPQPRRAQSTTGSEGSGSHLVELGLRLTAVARGGAIGCSAIGWRRRRDGNGDNRPASCRSDAADLPAGRYVASLTFGDDAQRLVFLQFLPMLYPGDAGNFHCSATDRQVTRSMSVLDADLGELPGHKLRCQGKFILSRPGARFIMGLSKTEGARAYPGNEGCILGCTASSCLGSTNRISALSEAAHPDLGRSRRPSCAT